MARGRKPYNVTHIVSPTSQVTRKKKATAEVRLPGESEVIFTGRSRHECFKWIYDTFNGTQIKVQFMREAYGTPTSSTVTESPTTHPAHMVEFYDQSSKTRITLAATEKATYGTPEKPKYALKAENAGRTLVRFVSKAEFDTVAL